MKRALSVAALAAVGMFSFAPQAAAQGLGGGGSGGSGGGSQGPSSGFPGAMEPSPESGLAKESQRSVKLFDSKRVTQSFELDIGPVWYRKAGRNRDVYERGLGEFMLGVAISTSWKPFYITGLQQTHLRIFDGSRAA